MGFNRNFTLTLQSSDMAYWKLQYQPFSSMMGTQHQKLHSLRGFPRYQKFFIKVHKAGIGRYIISQILSHHSLSYQKKKYITYHLLLMMASFWGCSMTLKKVAHLVAPGRLEHPARAEPPQPILLDVDRFFFCFWNMAFWNMVLDDVVMSFTCVFLKHGFTFVYILICMAIRCYKIL